MGTADSRTKAPHARVSPGYHQRRAVSSRRNRHDHGHRSNGVKCVRGHLGERGPSCIPRVATRTAVPTLMTTNSTRGGDRARLTTLVVWGMTVPAERLQPIAVELQRRIAESGTRRQLPQGST